MIDLSYWKVDDSICGEYPKKEDIEQWIKRFSLPLKVIDSWITEAWIEVEILPQCPHCQSDSPLLEYGGEKAILTYNNSD